MKQIQLTNYGFALVDDEYFEILSKSKWYCVKHRNTFYAIRTNDNKRMHRLILEATDPKILVDHADGNGLNNQRDNLRIATNSENCANRIASKGSTSGYLGVHWHKQKKRWRVDICKNKERVFIGIYKSEVDAAIAYNEAAIKYHGEFARLNQIPIDTSLTLSDIYHYESQHEYEIRNA